MMSQPSPFQGYKKNPLIFNKKNYFSNVFKEACRLHCSPEQRILVINLNTKYHLIPALWFRKNAKVYITTENSSWNHRNQIVQWCT